MNRALASMIVESLSCRGVPEFVYEEMKEVESAEWEKTMWWLSGSGLPHYFLARLQHSHHESLLPAAIHATLSQHFSANQRRVDTMAEEFANLTRLLDETGIECAAVRGFELSPEYCSNLFLRTWYTHEYVVPREQLRDASKVVEQAGYPLRTAGSRGELYFAVPEMQPPSALQDAYSDAFPRMVVLHSQVWDRSTTGIEIVIPGDLLQRKVTRRSHGISFPTLADDDLLAVTLIDTFARVVNYWCKLSWLLEICHFLELRTSDEMFWERFYRRIADCGKLAEIADFLFSLCAWVFNAALPELVADRASHLNSSLVLWIHHYGKRWALAEYPGSKLSLLVQRKLIADEDAWKRIRRQRLFPLLQAPTTASTSFAISKKRGNVKRKLSRVLDRIRFHGPATYTYLCELPRWNRLLNG